MTTTPTQSPEKAEINDPNGVWLVADKTVYMLEDTDQRIGRGATYRPQQRNRLWFQVQGSLGVPDAESQAIAKSIADALNAPSTQSAPAAFDEGLIRDFLSRACGNKHPDEITDEDVAWAQEEIAAISGQSHTTIQSLKDEVAGLREALEPKSPLDGFGYPAPVTKHREIAGLAFPPIDWSDPKLTAVAPCPPFTAYHTIIVGSVALASPHTGKGE